MTTYRPVEVRFWQKVALPNANGCLIWTASRDRHGYGQLSYGVRGRHILAHRFSFLLAHGAIPEGMDLDHLCRVPACVNPEHLEAVSHAENLRRAHFISSPRRAIERTSCPAGHLYDDANTYVNQQGARSCRACNRIRAAARRARNRH